MDMVHTATANEEAAMQGTEPFVTTERRRVPSESPEGQPWRAWRCANAGCRNRRHWVGYDDEGWGVPDACECENEECTCTTTLRQDFHLRGHIRPDSQPDVDYEAFTGGGDGAEIGPYTRIACAACGTWLWAHGEWEGLADG